MNQIARRAKQTPAVNQQSEESPARSHKGDGLIVGSQLTLGVEPRLSLAWRVNERRWADGFSLLVFHSTTGFSPEELPKDLSLHGRLIIETRENATYNLVPEEGTHFFSFVLRKTFFFNCFESTASVVRFSEIVPSGKVALGRIRDRVDLQQLLQQYKVGDISAESAVNEATLRNLRSKKNLEDFINGPTKLPHSGVDPSIRENLDDIDAIVQGLVAKKRKKADLMKSEEFRSLDPDEQKMVMDRIDERLDAAEISARREARRNQKRG